MSWPWESNPTLMHAVHEFASEASAWACKNIGDIFRKKKILHRLRGIQSSTHYYHSVFLKNLEK